MGSTSVSALGGCKLVATQALNTGLWTRLECEGGQSTCYIVYILCWSFLRQDSFLKQDTLSESWSKTCSIWVDENFYLIKAGFLYYSEYRAVPYPLLIIWPLKPKISHFMRNAYGLLSLTISWIWLGPYVEFLKGSYLTWLAFECSM